MAKITSCERFKRMYEHREADRVPMMDSPWGSTIERWRREGLPKDVSYIDYFGLDRCSGFGVDVSPRYPEKVIEETDRYTTYTTSWAQTIKNWKHATSTPEFMDFTIKDPDASHEAKKRMTPTDDRHPLGAAQEGFSQVARAGRLGSARGCGSAST